MATKLIDKVVNTEPSGLGFIPPSLKPRPEFYPRHASKVANHPQPSLPRSLPRERMEATSASPKGSQNQLPRMHLLKLFGNSEWGPNRGYESAQKESKESRSAASWCQRSALETPSAIFQTVSPGTQVNDPCRVEYARFRLVGVHALRA